MSTAMMDQADTITINKKLVCRYVGYSPDVEPSPRIAALLDEYVENAGHLLEPSFDYALKDVREVRGSQVFIEGDVVFESQVISKLLSKCRQVAIFVLTIGGRLEEIAAKLAEDNMIVESYILDAIGSSAVEGLAESVNDRIRKRARHRGLAASRRFSPGYCDWSINQQEAVFRALAGQTTSSVQLSSGCLMTPQKSISGIIGIGTGDSGVTDYNPCKTCEKRNCVGRR